VQGKLRTGVSRRLRQTYSEAERGAECGERGAYHGDGWDWHVELHGQGALELKRNPLKGTVLREERKSDWVGTWLKRSDSECQGIL